MNYSCTAALFTKYLLYELSFTIDVFDFSLSDEDMAAMAALDKKESSFFPHYDPAMIEWFVQMVEES